ncbi:SWIM-type domain-containing protein [Trichonephila clavipes]|nr:SWIM-type domain-containing protein [Trichonephila clavipes]
MPSPVQSICDAHDTIANGQYGAVWSMGHTQQVISATCTCPAGGTPAFCKHVFSLLHAINDHIAKKLYEAPTERLQTWHQPKPIKMVPQTSEELFMRELAIAVENEIGFDFTAAPFFTSPLMEVYKNMQEIKLKETIPLPDFVSSGKIATDLPQMGLEEILYYHRHYSKSIDELTALENRTVQQNCNEVLTNIPAVRYGLENEDYVRHTVQQRNPHYVVRKTGLVVDPIQQYIAASPDGLIRSVNNVSTSAMSRQHVKSCRSSQSGRQDVESRNMAGSGLPSSLMTEITTARIGEMI